MIRHLEFLRLFFHHQNYFQINQRFKCKNENIRLLEEKTDSIFIFNMILEVCKAFLGKHNIQKS